jgi:hypothetical protein
MAETGGGRVVGFGDVMGMEALRDREADTYTLYTNACFSRRQSLHGLETPFPFPTPELYTSRTNPRCRWKEESELLWSPLRALSLRTSGFSRSASAGFLIGWQP